MTYAVPALVSRAARRWWRAARPLALLALLLPSLSATAQVVAGRAAPTEAARKQVLREALHLGAAADLRSFERLSDPLGFAHEQYQLYYQGVKVEHGQVRIHSRGGKVESVSGETAQPAAGRSATPALTEAAALQRAVAAVGARVYKWQLPDEEAALKEQTGKPTATYQPHGELVWVGDFRQPEATRPLVLAWKFDIYAHEPVSRAYYYIDAQTGQVVLHDDIIKHLNAPGATFATRYVGTRTATTDNYGSGYRLRQTVNGRGITTLNMRKGSNFSAAVDFTDNDNNWTAAEHDNANFDNAALDAHLGAQVTLDYWATVHGRDSYDDKGAVLLSYVHYLNGLDNATWNGTSMQYGDGNGLFKPLTAIDVCGHEIGHGVCQYTANLVYANESGALNESLSDIWGACIKNYLDPTKQIWLIGEDIALPPIGVAIRSLSNPNQYGDPDTYQGTNWRTGPSDGGGIHHNSGVLNFWFYLLSQGGTGTNDKGTAYSVSGITIQKAERIAYRAERLYMSPNTNYAGARLTTMQAALDLYGFGSAEAQAVAQAWRAVGVGDATGNTEAAPTITSFTPTSGLPGTSITLTGTNLSATFSVSFNGVAAKLGTVTSATSVTVTVPAGATTGAISLTTPSGTATSATAFTVTAAGAVPTITGFTPAAGQVEAGNVTITGTNLSTATAVSFNGTPATILTKTATAITTKVPVGAASGALTATTPAGTATAPTTFTVLPAISSFSPGSGAVGTAVTLTGTNFTGATAVRFNGAYATSFTVTSATSLTATVPNGATTGPITVRTPIGTGTSTTSFAVTPSLAFDSFVPARGAWGSVVSLRGRGFTGATAIAFGGVSAPTFTVVSDGEIWATVPTNAVTGTITITTPLGATTSSGPFTVLVLGAPVISSFSPTNGSAGMSVTLTGANFSGATAVKFNGTTATFTVNSATSITTTVPAGFTTGLLSVTNANGTASSDLPFGLSPSNDQCSGAITLSYGSSVTGSTLGATTTGDPIYTCNGIEPSDIGSGGGGVWYQFVGNGALTTLSTCTAADFDTRIFLWTGSCGAYSCYTVNDDGCGTTAGASSFSFISTAGTNYLVFIDGTGAAHGTFTLTLGSPPTITSFTPASGTAATSVTITGTNFTGVTAVTFGGAGSAGGVLNSATQMTITVGSLALSGPIRVITPSGTATSATNFTVLTGAPTLTSFTPASGGVGTAVTLTGTNFNGVTAVRFNGTAATGSIFSNTSITAIVPAGATTGPITVTTPNGTATSAASFTVIPPPANDQCAGALALSCGVPVSGSTTTSTSTNDPTASCNSIAVEPTAGGVWYRFTGTGTSTTISTEGGTTNYDTKLFVYSGTCGVFTCVTANDDIATNAGNVASRVTFTGTAGTTYYVLVSGYTGTGTSGARGNFTLTTTCAAPPVITSLSPTSGPAGTSVTLTGTGLIGSAPGATIVSVNGVAVTPTALTATSLTFGVPAGASSTQSITVTTPDGTSPANTSFTVRLALTATSPVTNARTAPRANSAVGLTFSEPVTAASITTAASGIKVHSAQIGGRKAGTWIGGGTSAIAYTSSLSGSRTSFQAGEVVSVTVPATIVSAGGLAVPKRVYQFTAATGGTGTGLFGAPTNLSGGNGAGGVTLGDVNGDGLLDILWPNYNGTTVSVALATGPGTYAAATSITVAGNPVMMALADLDNDGDLDFVTANYGNPAGTGSNLSIGLNSGAGAFTVATLTTATGPRWVAPGDVDGDGDLDLIVPVGTGVQVYANSGSGTFALLSTVSGINFAIAAVAADVDGDGDLDLLTSNYFQSNTVSVRLNNGAGTFSGSQQVAVGTQPFHLAVGDVDADGDLDLVTANQGASTVSVRFNNGSGTFAPPAIAADGEVAVVSSVTNVALGDVDADGDLDLVASGTGGSLRLNNGSGGFSNPGANGTIASASGFPVLADADNDGDLDLATSAGSVASVRLNQAPAPTLASLSPTSGLVGTSITLTGTGFIGATGVSFNGTAATTFSVTNATTATATVPAGATSGNMTITTPDGTSNGVAFTVVTGPVPTITSYTPAAGTYEGQAVTITGTNLTGATVRFNGTLATLTTNTATSISTKVPVGATTGPLTVTTTNGTATAATTFTVTPFVSAFSPTSGPVGTSVTITGTSLTGATLVKFNTTNAASFTVNSATQITAIVAAGTTTGKVTVTTPSGTRVTGANFTITASPATTVTSFAPASGTAGTVVTLTGTNFTGATAVTFNTTAATSFTVNSTTSITATVPVGATTGAVKVTTPGGTATSTGSFTVCQPPATPAGFSYGGAYNGKFYFVSTSTTDWPSARQACLNAGGDLVAISSAAENAFVYSLTAGVNDLWIGYNDLATEGTFVWSNGEANSYENWFAGEPNDFNGEDYTGIYSASDTWNDFGASNLLRGVLELSACVAAPTITSFSPTSGPTGTVVTLTGTGFTGATAVRFNGTVATSFTVGSATSLTATVPAGATTGSLSVTTPGGTATSATSFTVTTASGPVPTITSFSPAAGTYEGQAVTITGTNLTGATVRFNGTLATITTNTATSISTKVPAGATTGPLTVTTSGGTATSSLFSVLPYIAAFTPTSGPVGTSVTITGTTLTGATVVKFNTTNAASYVVNSATSITAVVAAGTTTGKVTVTTPSGSRITGANFTITASPVPTLTSFTPAAGPVGTSVTLTGTGFTGATAVKFNGTSAASYTVVSSTSITATVPGGATTGTVSVTTAGGTATSATSFSVTASGTAPTITSFSPATGPVGTLVTLTGTGFTGATVVAFNGTAATFTVLSATSLTATVPGGSTSGLLSVTTAGGTASSATAFSVTTSGATPTITALSPAAGQYIGSVVTLTGTNLTGATSVSFNGTSATPAAGGSATSCSVTVPAGATSGPLTVSTPSGTSAPTASYNILPYVTAFSPTSGPAGTTVVLTGTAFTGATVVKFNATNAASFTVNSSTKITAVVAAGTTTGKVTVTTPSGTRVTGSSFTITAARAASVVSAPTNPEWTLYPNPAHGWVRVALRTGEPTPAAALRIQVANVLGQQLVSGTLAADEREAVLDVRALPTGVYTVRVGTTMQRLVVE